MPRMTGGDAIVDSLLRHGIDTIYGLPGVQLYGLFDAFARNANRLRVVNARHEQTTAYMAFGAAQSTGKPQACSVVPGPGLLNAATALSTAWGVNSPVICITGEVPSAQLGRERRQLHELPNQLATALRPSRRCTAANRAPASSSAAAQEIGSQRLPTRRSGSRTRSGSSITSAMACASIATRRS